MCCIKVLQNSHIKYNERMSSFEWDNRKNLENQEKHDISFELVQYAFLDENRIIAVDEEHGNGEERFYCFGKIEKGIVTVRFTMRGTKIRIFGAGFWRKGKRIYEQENKIH